MHAIHSLLSVILAFSLLAGCSAMPPQPRFRVIAYVTEGIIPEIIPYQRLTHINYAFLIPNADGTFKNLLNPWKLKKIAAQARENGVQTLIAVGGWGWDAEFEAIGADPVARAAFVQNLKTFVDEYALDGADIDWEYPDAGVSAQNFLALIRELRAAMPNKLITTAVVAYGPNGEGVLSETFEFFDFVNIMTYEGGSAHGTLQQFEDGLDYWQARGLPPEKMVMGVPFYAVPNGVAYAKLVAADPAAAQVDVFDYYGVTVQYNGIPTIQTKTRIAMQKTGGIMFWTLDHDAQGDLSLLKAIDEVVREK